MQTQSWGKPMLHQLGLAEGVPAAGGWSWTDLQGPFQPKLFWDSIKIMIRSIRKILSLCWHSAPILPHVHSLLRVQLADSSSLGD